METISSLKKKLWKVFSIYIRTRDADWRGYVKCCTCSAVKQWKEVDAGHYISRSKSAVLFDERNVHAQCKRCNGFMSGNPASYTLFLEKRYGKGIIKELDKKSRELKSFSIKELKELIKHYKDKTNV